MLSNSKAQTFYGIKGTSYVKIQWVHDQDFINYYLNNKQRYPIVMNVLSPNECLSK